MNGKNNIAGLIEIDIIDVNDVVDLPDAYLGISTEPPVVSASFQKIRFVQESGQMTESAQDMAGDESYTVEISGVIAKIDAESMQLLYPLPDSRWMIITRDRNNVRRIVGTPDNPARISITENTTGQNPADRNQFTLSVSWTNRAQSVIIDGWVPTDEDVINGEDTPDDIDDTLPYLVQLYYNDQGDLIAEYKEGKSPAFISASVNDSGQLVITASAPESESNYSYDETLNQILWQQS